MKIVLVSNRGPVSFVRGEAGYGVKRGAGGLAGALHPVARRLGDEAVWIAAATSDVDREALETGADEDLPYTLGYHVRFLDIDRETYARYYDVVSNRMLWFANHALWDELGIDGFERSALDAWDDAYDPVNKAFAEAASEAASPESLVLFQDYHLAIAPAHLRRARPGQAISHFTHSSFSHTGLRRLPEQIRNRLLRGMLGADLLGFHVPAWGQAFLECCGELDVTVDHAAGLVAHDGETWIRSYPIPIDAKSLRERASKGAARRWAERFRGDSRGRICVVRADRTEPSKNIVRGFQAFGRLLDRRADLAARAQFIACLYPSRQSLPEYRTYRDRIAATVDEVNERHPGSIELFLEDDFDRTLGALSVYDVLLVNPLMDGMNLVAKEGPAVNENQGVLVLSKRAGAFHVLGAHAVPIADPFDLRETEHALETAIDLDDNERWSRADALRAAASGDRPEDWIEPQLEDLEAIKRTGTPKSDL